MLAKGSVGPATRHILASTGPGSYPFDQYSTTYSVQYNRKAKHEASFRHKGTGYAANFRPAVYYSKEADKSDNPMLARLVSDNYGSQTSRDFTRPALLTGNEQLPGSVRCGASGFTHNLPFTRALSNHHASRITQYNTSYPHKQFRSSLKVSGHSNKEESGFTHACNDEPITHRPNENHAGDFPTSAILRPTGHSITKQDFRQNNLLVGNEALPCITARRTEACGYIKGNQCVANAQPFEVQEVPVPNQIHPRIKKRDPVAYTAITDPQKHATLTQLIYRGDQHHHTNTPYTAVGNKELSGFAENYPPYVGTKSSGNQPTHYTANFSDRRQQLADVPHVHPVKSSGFTKSTRVHGYRPVHNPVQTLRQQEPYAARSIISKDPCFVDLTHRHKDVLTR